MGGFAPSPGDGTPGLHNTENLTTQLSRPISLYFLLLVTSVIQLYVGFLQAATTPISVPTGII